MLKKFFQLFLAWRQTLDAHSSKNEEKAVTASNEKEKTRFIQIFRIENKEKSTQVIVQ